MFRKIADKVDLDLSVYEVNPERLAEKYSKELEKPISVTMCAVDMSAFVNKGGLLKP